MYLNNEFRRLVQSGFEKFLKRGSDLKTLTVLQFRKMEYLL